MKKQIFSLLLLSSFVFSVSAQEISKFDEFGEFQCEYLRGRLDNFIVHLRNEPNAKGFVIVYEGKYSRPIYDRTGKLKYKDYLPAVGEAKYRMWVISSHFKYRRFPVDRISVINGGFREDFTVEFWVVPIGAKPPVASPTLDKMKYRKGKPAKIVCET